MTYTRLYLWRLRRSGAPYLLLPKPSLRGGLVVSWCGMRGIVTLAAALALPWTFPERDLIVLTAFAVVVGTLIVQGLTLRPLLRVLHLRNDRTVEREIRLAWSRVLETAVDSIRSEATPTADALRGEWTEALRALAEDPCAVQRPLSSADHLRRRAIEASRASLTTLRARGDIGDDAFHSVEEYLDRVELTIDEV
jgi:CPA1 family monovalent cation:H+ antiporter